MRLAAVCREWTPPLSASWARPSKVGRSTQRYNLERQSRVRRTVGYHMAWWSTGACVGLLGARGLLPAASPSLSLALASNTESLSVFTKWEVASRWRRGGGGGGEGGVMSEYNIEAKHVSVTYPLTLLIHWDHTHHIRVNQPLADENKRHRHLLLR